MRLLRLVVRSSILRLPGSVPAAGTDTLSVTFTPTDTTNYTTATKTVQLTVTQVTPAITWATPVAITYGTALSSTQLNATASVPGTLVYTPAAGTVPSAGTVTLSVHLHSDRHDQLYERDKDCRSHRQSGYSRYYVEYASLDHLRHGALGYTTRRDCL